MKKRNRWIVELTAMFLLFYATDKSIPAAILLLATGVITAAEAIRELAGRHRR